MVYRADILILHVEKIELSYIMKVLEIERTMVVPIVETKTKKGSFLLFGTKYKAKNIIHDVR